MAQTVGTALAKAGTDSPLDGFFKKIYAPTIKNKVPTSQKIQGHIGFETATKIGEDFQQTVILQLEHGITYAGPEASGGANSYAPVTLQAPVVGATRPATIKPSQLFLRSRLSYETAFASQTSEQAFMNATKHLVKNMWYSVRKRLEIECLYGRSATGMGALNADPGTGTTFVISAATWSPGIWAGMEGASIVFFDSTLATYRATNASRRVTKVDFATRTITVNSALDAELASGDIVFFGTHTGSDTLGGQRTNAPAWNSMLGIDGIVTTSGSLFGISNTEYTLWAANTQSASSGDLSFGLVQDACAKSMEKGADGDMLLEISPVTWANLMGDQAALRRYDSSQNSSKYVVGAKAIDFYSQTGKVEIEAHIMVKQGEGFLIAPEDFTRFGTTDVTFERPSMPGVQREPSYFLELADAGGWELRCYTGQCIFTDSPGHQTKITTIVNS